MAMSDQLGNFRILRGRRKKRGEGKTARRVKEILETTGWSCTHLSSNDGYWSQPEQDVMRWEAHLVCARGLPMFVGGCWHTMTEFVRYATRYGFAIDFSNDTVCPAMSPEEASRVIALSKTWRPIVFFPAPGKVAPN